MRRARGPRRGAYDADLALDDDPITDLAGIATVAVAAGLRDGDEHRGAGREGAGGVVLVSNVADQHHAAVPEEMNGVIGDPGRALPAVVGQTVGLEQLGGLAREDAQ